MTNATCVDVILSHKRKVNIVREYVEKRSGGYYLVGSRVSLESVIYEFLDGASPKLLSIIFPRSPWSRSTEPSHFISPTAPRWMAIWSRPRNCGKTRATISLHFPPACENVSNAPAASQAPSARENQISRR